jgi:hypothetical protein
VTLGSACLECIRVGVGEVSRTCFADWYGDCGHVCFRLDAAHGGGVGVAGGVAGEAAQVFSPSCLMRALRRPPFPDRREVEAQALCTLTSYG